MTIRAEFRDELKKALESEKSRLEANLRRFANPAGAEGDYETRYEDIGRDEEDNMTETEMYADNVALEETLEHELSEVNKARARVQSGTYGTCLMCGKDIEEGRLKAYPAADDCMEHAK